MLVVDASVLVVALADDGGDGDRVRGRLHGEQIAAPEIIDLEVTSVLRKQVASGSVALRRADLALADLIELPMRRVSHRALLPRCWELRQNLTTYDVAYGALAEVLQAPLLTADSRLANAPALRCPVEVIGRSRQQRLHVQVRPRRPASSRSARGSRPCVTLVR